VTSTAPGNAEQPKGKTWHKLSAEWRAGRQRVDDVEWEVTPAYDYYLNRFASVFARVDLEGAGDHFEKHEGVFGLRYLLTKHFSLIGQWHSQFGWGGGLRWQF